jgi:hypothetical protein
MRSVWCGRNSLMNPKTVKGYEQRSEADRNRHCFVLQLDAIVVHIQTDRHSCAVVSSIAHLWVLPHFVWSRFLARLTDAATQNRECQFFA